MSTAEAAQMDETPERQRALQEWVALENERSTWLTHWQDLNDYIIPRRFRYLQTERNRGTKRNDKIINNKATKSARTLGAGKMAGETSPARPWARFVLSDLDLKNDPECVQWVNEVYKITMEAMAKSNIYSKIHEMWFQQGVFATAALYIEEHPEDGIYATVFPLGQYCLATSTGERIDTIMRKFDMTVQQVVRKFGIENCSEPLRRRYKARRYHEWVQVLHEIRPNLDRQNGRIDNHNMPFVSNYWEVDAPGDWTKPLRRSGYEEFPVVVARWDVIGEDIYGSGSPGMDALGDVKALQKLEIRKAEAVDKVVRPPMKAPISAKTSRLTTVPGDVSYVDETAQGAKFEPSMEINPNSITAAESSCREHETRIVETFFANLFLAMFMDERGVQPVTAREIDERHEEKMLMLGPVVERDEDDVLDPMFDRIIRVLARAGWYPPMPAKMAGRKVKIEYISIMAQAQKLLGTMLTERFASFVGSLSAVAPEVKKVPAWMRMVRNYAERLGLSPDEINSEDVVQQMIQAEQAQQAAMQQAQMVQAGAQAAKVASETDMGGDTALSRMMQAVGARA